VTPDVGDIRPLGEREMLTFRRYWPTLLRGIDANSGLLDELLMHNLITDKQKQQILLKETDMGKNEVIVRLLRRKSVADLKTFVECLRKTNQYRTAWLLSGIFTLLSCELTATQSYSKIARKQASMLLLNNNNEMNKLKYEMERNEVKMKNSVKWS
jgi:Caspase recruitment domain